MPGTQELALFIVSGLLLNLTPGADLLYITSRGAAGGPFVLLGLRLALAERG